MVKVRKNLIPSSLYSWKSPYDMNPTRIVVHNTANDASADNEIKYMNKSKEQGGVQTSFHYAVDDKEAVQGLPENRNGFHAGDGAKGKGNREGIAIEICYSKSGGDKFIKAEQNAVELIVDILKRYGWGIDKVTKHQDYAKKYCPHRTLDMGWDRFINMIKNKLNSGSSNPIKELKIENIANKSVRLKIDANLWNLDFNTYAEAKSVKQFKKGDILEVSAIAYHPIGAKYYLTEYSYSKNIHNGFNVVDCEDITTSSFFGSKGYFSTGDSHENIGKIASFMFKVFPSYTKKEALGNYYGKNLQASIKEFQRRTKIKVSGNIDETTVKELEKYGFKK